MFVEQVRAGIEVLRWAADRGRVRFPVVGAPLAHATVAAWERSHGVVLPGDYRAYLTEIGNGGPGPGSGLFELDADSEGDVRRDPGAPFPYVEHFPGGDEDTPIDGTVYLCHEGCGHYDLLVIHGAERGHVWQDSRVNDFGLWPLEDEGRGRVTFADWYLRWLDEQVRKVTRG